MVGNLVVVGGSHVGVSLEVLARFVAHGTGEGSHQGVASGDISEVGGARFVLGELDGGIVAHYYGHLTVVAHLLEQVLGVKDGDADVCEFTFYGLDFGNLLAFYGELAFTLEVRGFPGHGLHFAAACAYGVCAHRQGYDFGHFGVCI